MGEAKRRAERRREAREADRPRLVNGQDYSPFFVPDAMNEELKIEFAFFQKRYPDAKLGIRDYMVLLLEAAVERERQAREAAESKEKMVQLAATLPPGIEKAAKRLQTIKAGPGLVRQ